VNSADFVDSLSEELATARQVAAAVFDRCEALCELLDVAVEVSNRRGAPVTAEAVFASPESEQERAALAALVVRITNPAALVAPMEGASA
jgi:hypothetical protein